MVGSDGVLVILDALPEFVDFILLALNHLFQDGGVVSISVLALGVGVSAHGTCFRRRQPFL